MAVANLYTKPTTRMSVLNKSTLNLGDPQRELMDRTADVHALFAQFNAKFFWGKLPTISVRWSKRMYSCAGCCRYRSRSRLCDISLSEPLLKLRPHKDLVATLLHEMIHAYLIIVERHHGRPSHGPNFKKHMHRINNEANVNITIYHNFFDEMNVYKVHWWRCTGTCRIKSPHFGIVRRSCNRTPTRDNYYKNRHQDMCGGTFQKIKEPGGNRKSTSAIDSSVTPAKIKKTSTDFPTKVNSDDSDFCDSEMSNSTTTESDFISLDDDDDLCDSETSNSSTTESDSISLDDDDDFCVSETSNSSTAESDSIRSDDDDDFCDSETINSTTTVSDSIRLDDDDDFCDSETSNSTTTVADSIRLDDDNDSEANKSTGSMAHCPLCTEIVGHSLQEHLSSCMLQFEQEFSSPSITTVADCVRLDHGDDLCDSETSKLTGSIPYWCPCCNVMVTKMLENHLDTCMQQFEQEFSSPSITADADCVRLDHGDDLCDSETSKLTGSMDSCPCCNLMVTKMLENHLEACIQNFEQEFSSPSMTTVADCVRLDDGDGLCDSETSKLTGSMDSCPCCNLRVTKMLENHLDTCMQQFEQEFSSPSITTVADCVRLDDDDDFCGLEEKGLNEQTHR